MHQQGQREVALSLAVGRVPEGVEVIEPFHATPEPVQRQDVQTNA